MTAGPFQVPAPSPAQLNGTIQAQIIDSGGTPNDVINENDKWSVELDWQLTGTLVPLIAGTWNVRLSIDQIGGPNDFSFPLAGPDNVPVTPANGVYKHTIDVPGGTLKGAVGGNNYTVIASLGYTTPANTPGPMGGYVNCGVVSVTL